MAHPKGGDAHMWGIDYPEWPQPLIWILLLHLF